MLTISDLIDQLTNINVLHSHEDYLPGSEQWCKLLIDQLPSYNHYSARSYSRSCSPKHLYRYAKEIEYDLTRKATDSLAVATLKLIAKVKYKGLYTYQRSMHEYIQKHNIQILHSHFANVGYRDISVAKKRNVPHVISFYGWDYEALAFRDQSWSNRLSNLFAHASAIITEGPHGKKILIDQGCDPSKIYVVPLGINIRKSSPPSPKTRDNNDTLKLIQVANYVEKKGQLHTLKAFHKTLEAYPKILLTLVGKQQSEYFNKCKSYIQQNNLNDKIKLLDFYPYDKLPSLLQEHDVFIHPSCYSADKDCEGGAPTILFNAMLAGLPVISTRHCDIPFVVEDGTTGLLSTEGNIDQISESITNFANMKATRYRQYSLNAIKRVQTMFDVKENAKHLNGIYTNLC